MTNGLLFFIENLTAKLLFFQFLFENMSKQITVKYYSESEFAKEPYQATEDSTGYDLFAAETKTFLPKTVDTLSIDRFKMSHTNWFLWKIISTKKLFP